MTIEQRLAEIIRAFHADALSSTVNLNVDLDIMLYRPRPSPARRAARPPPRLRHRHPRHPATPLPGNPRHTSSPPTTPITVRLDRRAYTPVLRQADLPTDTPIPWWGNRTLRYEFA